MDKSIKIWVIKINIIKYENIKDLNTMKLLYSLDEAHDHEIFSISLSNDD
jgi:hypothetical protein